MSEATEFETTVIGPVTLYFADCREVAPTLTGVDVTVADPPYGDTSLDWDSIVGGWTGAMPGSQLWCFGSFRFFLSERFPTWKLAQEIVWEKHNGSSFHADRFKRVHELLVHFYRGDWNDLYREPQYTHDATKRTVRRKKRPPHTGRIDQGAYVSEDGGPRLMRSVLQVRSCHGHAIHPTQKPTGIIEPVMRFSSPPGGLVFEPFAGSGSVCEAAMLSGRRAIGCEVNRAYFEAAAKRLQRAWREHRSQLPFQESPNAP